MNMANSDWSKRWDEDKSREPMPAKWKHFISGFILGGFVTIAIMYSFDTLMRWLIGYQ